MATLKRFEDLEVWQKARNFANKLHNEMKKKPFSNDVSLTDQLNRCSGSIMDNIAEGFERESRNEFLHYLSIAKGSAGEARSQLYRAKDRNYLTQKTFNDFFQM